MRALVISLSLVLSFFVVLAQYPEETESQKRMAVQNAEKVDRIWDEKPEEGANIRILMMKDGKPFFEKTSIYCTFKFRAVARWEHHQAFNPNKNGRWVYTGLEPGTYNLVVEGTEAFEGFLWEKGSYEVKEGDAPLFEIPLD